MFFPNVFRFFPFSLSKILVNAVATTFHIIESVEVAAQPGRGAMANVVGAYYRDAPCTESGRYALISTRVFGQAVNKQHAGLRVFDWPVPILNAAGETFHVVVLRFV